MRNLCDFMIIQRDAKGFGKATFAGTLKDDRQGIVLARVVREDDNMTVVPFTECERSGADWHITLTLPQGGLYRAEARLAGARMSDTNNNYDWAELIACVYHIGVGDVFIMAGQSNMSGYGKDPAYDPPELGVHLFDNAGRWGIAAHPLSSVPDPIYENNDGSSGTSPGLAFARTMRRSINVPVGLVAAARGGSALEAWNPAEEAPYLYNELRRKIKEIGGFAGMIWYQGCSETTEQDEAETYLEKFTQTVELWRKEFGYFPIATCQINRHAWKGEDKERHWGLVREAQRQAARTIKDVYVVPTIDMYTSDGIHNASGACVVIGERLAQTLLAGWYKLPGCFAPSVNTVKRLDDRRILLTFDGKHMLKTMDDLAAGMNIEDENGIMPCMSVSVRDDGAVVTAQRSIGKNAVFHAYWQRETPAFFLRDIYGMPMLACYNVKIE